MKKYNLITLLLFCLACCLSTTLFAKQKKQKEDKNKSKEPEVQYEDPYKDYPPYYFKLNWEPRVKQPKEEPKK